MHSTFTMLWLVIGAAFLAVVSAGEFDGSDVKVLDAKNFDQIYKSDGLWLVEFYAPWCGHCRNLEPEWKKAATQLKGVVTLASVNADVEKELGQKFGIQGFPTIKVFGANKNKPTDYQGPRTADGIVSSALSTLQDMVNARTGQKKKSSKSSGGGGSGERAGANAEPGEDVVKLELSTFDKVFADNDIWFVEFYAPWCGHCKNLAPEWGAAATDLKGHPIHLAAVDAQQEQQLAAKYGVHGYPTIKVFMPGRKDAPEDYTGPRHASGIVEYAMQKLDEAGQEPEIKQAISDAVFVDGCLKFKKICVLAVLPHIFDGGAAARNGYLDVLKKTAKRLRARGMTFVWMEAGSQPKLEAVFGMTYGFPAVVAINDGKQKYVTHTGPFDETHLTQTLTVMKVSGGFSALPSLTEVPEWDGGDYVPPADEDY